MNTILSVAVISILGALLCLVLKKSNSELSLLLSVGTLTLIITAVFGKFEQLTEWIDKSLEHTPIDQILNVLLKTLGIAVTADIAAQHCRDCGENGLAAGVDLTAKILIILIVLPLIDNFILVIEEVLRL